MRADHITRHQVRRELHAAEIELHDRPDGAHQGGLAQARQPFKQDVAATEQANEHELVQFLAAQQAAVHLLANLPGDLGGRIQLSRLEQGGVFTHGHFAMWTYVRIITTGCTCFLKYIISMVVIYFSMGLTVAVRAS